MKKIIEAKTDGKKFWNLIKDLLWKSNKKKEEAYVYLEVGEKYNIQDISREYIDKWKKEIYH